jgi:uncharacterized protein
MAGAPDALFEPAIQGGQRLYLHHSPPPGQAVRAAVLYVHPWAEEMNKSRRMAALASRALADSGCAVLQVDLLGCGDSSGDFADASWDAWLADLDEAAAWLQARHPQAPVWLWGLRVGALLAVALAPRLAQKGKALPNLLLWQPTLQGKTAWQQFLRLKAAAQMAEGGGKGVVAAARADVAAGRTVEVAGYVLHPRLAEGLEAASLRPPTGPGARVIWIELSTSSQPQMSAAAQDAQQTWRAAGWRVQAEVVAGPAFWQTVEVEDAPALVGATLNALAADAGTAP